MNFLTDACLSVLRICYSAGGRIIFLCRRPEFSVWSVDMSFLTDFLFGKEKCVTPYNPEEEEPVLRIGICTGEKVAGFSSLRNGRFREVMLITSDADMDEFCRRYAVDRDRIREITAG